MNHQRRVLLSLVAAGRITAAEAERLTLAWEAPACLLWQDIRDWAWVALIGMAAFLLQAHPHLTLGSIAGLLHELIGSGSKLLHTAAFNSLQTNFTTTFKTMGGRL